MTRLFLQFSYGQVLIKGGRVKTGWMNSRLMPSFHTGKDFSEKKNVRLSMQFPLYGWYLYALVNMSSVFKVLS